MFLQKQFTTEDPHAAIAPRLCKAQLIDAGNTSRVELTIPGGDKQTVEIPNRIYEGHDKTWHVAEFAAPENWSYDLSRMASDMKGVVAVRAFLGDFPIAGAIPDWGGICQLSLDPLYLSSAEVAKSPLTIRLYSEAKLEAGVRVQFKTVERKTDDERIFVVRSDWDASRAFYCAGGVVRPMWVAEPLEIVEPEPVVAPVAIPVQPEPVVPIAPIPVVPANTDTVMYFSFAVSVPRGQTGFTVAPVPAPIVVAAPALPSIPAPATPPLEPIPTPIAVPEPIAPVVADPVVAPVECAASTVL